MTTTETMDLLYTQQAITSDTAVPSDVTDRTAGLGGSDAAACVGISPYTTPLELYQRAVGEAEGSAHTYATRRGTVLEPILREEYELVTGRTAREVPSVRHPKYPWMMAHVDGQIDPERILEIKTAGLWVAQNWGEAGSDEIPEHYMLQVQHYLSVTGAKVCDVFAEIAGRDLQLFEVERDDELIGMLEDAEREFWHDHVLERRPPDPTSPEEAGKRWRKGLSGKVVELTDEVTETLLFWMEARKEAKLLTEKADQFKLDLQTVVGDAEALVDCKGRKMVTWKNNKDGQKFNVNRFKAKHPDLHKEFLEVKKGARPFCLKPAAESL